MHIVDFEGGSTNGVKQSRTGDNRTWTKRDKGVVVREEVRGVGDFSSTIVLEVVPYIKIQGRLNGSMLEFEGVRIPQPVHRKSHGGIQHNLIHRPHLSGMVQLVFPRSSGVRFSDRCPSSISWLRKDRCRFRF